MESKTIERIALMKSLKEIKDEIKETSFEKNKDIIKKCMRLNEIKSSYDYISLCISKRVKELTTFKQEMTDKIDIDKLRERLILVDTIDAFLKTPIYSEYTDLKRQISEWTMSGNYKTFAIGQ